MSEYLEPNNFMIKQNEAKTLFQLKSKMVQVKANYWSAFKDNLNCTLCSNEGKTRKETQKHIVKCPVITRRNPNKVHINYRDLKSDNVEEQVKVVKYFKENYIIRSQLLENMKTT